MSRSIGKELGVLSRRAQIYFKHAFKEYSIGHAQVMTLHHICKHDGLNQVELSSHFNLDKSSVTSQLNILEKNGYIRREKDSNDSRGRKIYITEKTKGIETSLSIKFSFWTNTLLKGFNEEEKEILFSLTDRMKANTDAAIREITDNE